VVEVTEARRVDGLRVVVDEKGLRIRGRAIELHEVRRRLRGRAEGTKRGLRVGLLDLVEGQNRRGRRGNARKKKDCSGDRQPADHPFRPGISIHPKCSRSYHSSRSLSASPSPHRPLTWSKTSTRARPAWGRRT